MQMWETSHQVLLFIPFEPAYRFKERRLKQKKKVTTIKTAVNVIIFFLGNLLCFNAYIFLHISWSRPVML